MGVLKKSEYLKMYIMKNMSEFQSFFFKQIEFQSNVSPENLKFSETCAQEGGILLSKVDFFQKTFAICKTVWYYHQCQMDLTPGTELC